MILVPYTELDPKTLEALIEEFVTRDGAVQGHQDRQAAEKVEAVVRQLRAGKVAIVFDEADATCTIVPTDSLHPELKQDD